MSKYDRSSKLVEEATTPNMFEASEKYSNRVGVALYFGLPLSLIFLVRGWYGGGSDLIVVGILGIVGSIATIIYNQRITTRIHNAMLNESVNRFVKGKDDNSS